MAQTLTEAALIASQSLEKSPNIVLKIDGLDEVFGASGVFKNIRYGEDNLVFGQDDLFYGGLVRDENSRDLIDLSGSTSRIEQQLEQDKGSISSVTNINIELIDAGQEITSLLAPGVNISDILGARASVFYLFQNTSFPEDAITLLDGVVADISFYPGSVRLKISHPTQFFRQTLFEAPTLTLSDNISDSQTSIPVESTNGVINQALPMLKTFYRIGDEIIRYTSSPSGQLLGVTRGELNTIAQPHDEGDELEPLFQLEGDCIDIALAVMLSGGPDFYAGPITPDDFIDTQDTGLIPNAIFFNRAALKFDFGVAAGDSVLIEAKPGTPFFPFFDQQFIDAVVENDSGSYIITNLDVSLLGDPDDFLISFRSERNILPFGMGMEPKQVDTAQFNRVKELFGADFPQMRVLIKEPKNGTSFINDEIIFPNGLYILPRSGRVSVGRTTPPLAELETQVLNRDSIVNPQNIRLSRSLNRNFYNAVIYRYDEDSIEDKTLFNIAILSADSINRIKFPNKPLQIKASGFRDDEPGTRVLIERQAAQFLERFRFAAEEVLNVQVPLGVGFNIDVGDAVIFGDETLSLADSQKGDRFFEPRVMEVTNKSFPISGQAITLRLLDTSYSALGRFGVISPSSIIDNYSDGTLALKLSFTQLASLGESQKWQEQIGEFITIHSPDWTISEDVRITGVGLGNPNAITITEPTITVEKGYIIDIASYAEPRTKNKSVHVFFNPQEFVDAGVSETEFSVTDATDLFEGAVISIHSPDYTRESNEVRIDNIDGLDITVSAPLGFTPEPGDEIELIGFREDRGLPYRIL